jgi:co-chaperonin GroES (HSP10)
MGFPLQPFEDVVIIEQELESKTTSGLILAGGAEKLQCGRVVAHGPGRTYAAYMDASGATQFGYRVPISVKVGDFVVFGKYQSGGEPLEFDGKKYLMCREGDLGGKTHDARAVTFRRCSE